MHPLVSVIVPVYRVERYLEEAVESILSQTLSNIEIILVDDGSDDRCPEICDRFQKEYENIVVIHQRNHGLPAARNVGINKANGKYIAFCDSDDIMKKDMLERMVLAAQNHYADIVMCGYETFPDKKNVYPGIKSDAVLTPKTFIAKCNTIHTGNELCFSWRFLLKKKYIEEKKIRFDEDLLFGEDVPFNIQAVMEASRIFVLQEILYFYRTNNTNSIMRTKYKPDLDELVQRQYQKKIELTYQYHLDQIDAWMEDLAYYYITGFADMLFNNAMNGPVEKQKEAVKKIIRMPLLSNNFQKCKGRLFHRGRINAIFWIACWWKIDWIVWLFVKNKYGL